MKEEKELKELIERFKGLRDLPTQEGKRELSIIITKLEEALLWYREWNNPVIL